MCATVAQRMPTQSRARGPLIAQGDHLPSELSGGDSSSEQTAHVCAHQRLSLQTASARSTTCP